MTRVIYGWRAGTRFGGDAQKVGESIAKLQQGQNEPLQPSVIVEAARDKKSPLHPHFEWDDSVAAEAYRQDQARDLVRSLTIDISKSNLEKRPVRAFLNVETGGDRGYVSTVTAMSSRELRKQIIEKAWNELEAWRLRHAELTELGRIFSMIDQGLEALPPS